MNNFGLPITGVLHVGANLGQERDLYKNAGVGPVLWVEPIPEIYAQLCKNIESYPGQKAVQAICTATEGEVVKFNVATNHGESSSIFELGKHGILYPNIRYANQIEIESTTLDRIAELNGADEKYNLLVVDTQGAELQVLKGSVETLKKVEGLYIEVSEEPLYAGGCTLEQLTNFLREQNFRIKWLEISSLGWGNAFFVNNRLFEPQELPYLGLNLALNKPTRQSSVYASAKPTDPVDGILSGTFGFHTALEDNPWWEVDLGKPTLLQELRVFNRGDACQIRAKTLKALLSIDGDKYTEVYDQKGKTFGIRLGDKALRIDVRGQVARFVRLQLSAREYFHLDEVEVY